MEKPTTISTSFRLPTATVDKIDELSKLLKESKTDVVARAIDLLHSNSEAAVKEDYEKRIGQAKKLKLD